MTNTTDVDSLRQEAQRIGREAKRLRQANHESANAAEHIPEAKPLRLAHYTSLEAMISMLQTDGGGLRLSDSSMMNDPEEGHTTSDGRTILRQLEQEFGKDTWLWKRYGTAKICCFVGVEGDDRQGFDAGNDLYFWRLYGDECQGMSVTMDHHLVQRLFESSVIQRVIYADEPRMASDIAAMTSLLQDLGELRDAACEVGVWDQICNKAVPECDRLMAQRFLWKRSHHKMEKEYRAVAFTTEGEDSPPEDSGFSRQGLHTKMKRIYTYVQVEMLDCKSILTTGSQITIGSNVPDPYEAREKIKGLMLKLGKAPGVVGIQVSKIPYQ